MLNVVRMDDNFINKKIGILGGGQLGRMLIQKGIDWNLKFSVLDPDASAPCHDMAPFTQGALTDFETVMKFGMPCDILTVEIENVNTDALIKLEQQGKKVFPQPHILSLIQDKRTQKKFFKDHNLPTAEFVLTSNRQDIFNNKDFLPAVNKLGREGYDGRGVQVLRSEIDLAKAFDAPGLLEKWIDFEKEISVIVARNEQGQVVSYPAVEMVFHPQANLVEYLFAPARILTQVAEQADLIARKIIAELNMVGVLAVEMFVTKSNEILVNEVAPRPHNSGHQTIEANVTSQYEQHLRAILNFPLGNTAAISPSAMINLLGEEGYSGPPRYLGMEKVLEIPGTYVHLYGKVLTKPFRKMGHVTILDADVESLKKKANFVKETLKIIA